VGDPSYHCTGLFYKVPHYIDDYSIISGQRQNYLEAILCGILGFTGFYYLALFLSIRRKRETYYLWFAFYSLLLCSFAITRSGITYSIIPNSDISARMNYISLILSIPMLGFFIESLLIKRITKINFFYLAFSLFIAITQIFFCAQYSEETTEIYICVSIIYFSYIYFYSIIYSALWVRRKKGIRNDKQDTVSGVPIANILIGATTIFFCGVFDVIDMFTFRNNFTLFIYSAFVAQLGMNLTLSYWFSGMYKQLEQSNVILETTVHERTRELEEQTRIAVKASRAKSEFLATMSHEIRTPLNTVIGLSEIELRERLSDSSRENITQIQQSGSVLLGIIGDILDISKIEAGNFELTPAQYETALLLNDTVNLNTVRIGSKPINFVLEIDGDFPARLVGDQLRVKQILNNLLSNAIKYTEEGTVTLTVTCEKINDGKEEIPSARLRFAVRDTGIGIREQDMGKLFENYIQIESEAGRKIEGTGLGLAITRQIVQMMGGNVTVESEYGKGSCFTAEIIQTLADDAVIGGETAEKLRNFSYATLRKKETIDYLHLDGVNVLVVDDNKANLQVARGLLTPYDFSIDTAISGREAVEKVKRKSYNMIFMDHMMPEMDGIEAAAALRDIDNCTHTPIIALTANAMQGMREFYLENGFNDYLSKPIHPKALDEVITKYFKDHAAKLPETVNNGQTAMNSGQRNVNIDVEIESRRLDKLNHYRAAFESGRPIDPEYFLKFTSLLESMNITDDSVMRKQLSLLAEAGRREDAHTIREMLPVFCETAALQAAEQGDAEGFQDTLSEILSRLKKTLKTGETKTAETVLSELGKVKLNSAERELYFMLYDFMVKNNPEKAVDAIYFWERLQNAWNKN
jgi:signal transduction histidine kinase/CheY-like chemotaxis protein